MDITPNPNPDEIDIIPISDDDNNNDNPEIINSSEDDDLDADAAAMAAAMGFSSFGANKDRRRPAKKRRFNDDDAELTGANRMPLHPRHTATPTASAVTFSEERENIDEIDLCSDDDDETAGNGAAARVLPGVPPPPGVVSPAYPAAAAAAEAAAADERTQSPREMELEAYYRSRNLDVSQRVIRQLVAAHLAGETPTAAAVHAPDAAPMRLPAPVHHRPVVSVPAPAPAPAPYGLAPGVSVSVSVGSGSGINSLPPIPAFAAAAASSMDYQLQQPPPPGVQDWAPLQGGGRGGGGGGGGGFGRGGGRGGQNRQWYIDYYDPSSNENPWERLEQTMGLEPRGSWLPSRSPGGGGGRGGEEEATCPLWLHDALCFLDTNYLVEEWLGFISVYMLGITSRHMMQQGRIGPLGGWLGMQFAVYKLGSARMRQRQMYARRGEGNGSWLDWPGWSQKNFTG
ncbi:hypothetical protein B0T17DRAFT_502468 [Bombardia bombarda]|uniref:Uncharacterized protein n=1 Tax=Bombardia bombarda TaxID=252184 RepID=A0AA40CDW9_9PEZI|nr:hypothetical protein B0T17DRAFT_502468 [Bombardia bombarda]